MTNQCACDNKEGQTLCGATLFISGLALGTLVGTGIGIFMAPSRRRVKKMARNTVQSVGEAMENLRESLHHYL